MTFTTQIFVYNWLFRLPVRLKLLTVFLYTAIVHFQSAFKTMPHRKSLNHLSSKEVVAKTCHKSESDMYLI